MVLFIQRSSVRRPPRSPRNVTPKGWVPSPDALRELNNFFREHARTEYDRRLASGKKLTSADLEQIGQRYDKKVRVLQRRIAIKMALDKSGIKDSVLRNKILHLYEELFRELPQKSEYFQKEARFIFFGRLAKLLPPRLNAVRFNHRVMAAYSVVQMNE